MDRFVRYEEIGQTEFALEVDQQVDHLGLHRDVEGRDRFVADQQPGFQGECPCDTDALALAAREFVWMPIDPIRAQTDPLHQLHHLGAAFGAIAAAVHKQWLFDDAANRQSRIERGIRVLKDHLHHRAIRPHPASIQASDLGAIEPNGTGGGAREADDGTSQAGFSAT